MFSYADVSKNINGWVNVEKKYYDIVLMINSLMHFSKESFWNQLNEIIKPNTLLLFNLVNMENNECCNNGIYMERKDNTVYYKFPIHNNIKQESYIDINEILNKGFTILEVIEIKYYKWYIVIKT